MSVIGLVGLKTKGPYCFYTIGNNTAILVGIKVKQGKPVVVPQQIGKYTVRGIDDTVCSSPMWDAMNNLKQKDLLRLQKTLNEYHKTSRLRMDQLPQTVEFIGFSMVERIGSPYGSLEQDILKIPAHIRYIRELRPSILFHQLVFPETLRYLGTVRSSASLSVEFSGPGSQEEPFHTLSEYLGKPMEEVPQLGSGAFLNCPKLHTLKLPDSIEKIGKGAFPTQLELYCTSFTKQAFQLHIPRRLRQVDPEIFRTARVSTLNYPDDLSPELRCQELPLSTVGHLIIHDIGQLEEYIRLVSQGNKPEQYPDKCLYHLIRVAERIVFPNAPKRILDGMFAGCEDLYQVTIGAVPETKNTSLTITEGVEIIGNDAFASCNRLIPDPLPSSVRYIGDRAFLGTKLSSLNFPEGLVHIGKQAFARCDNLKDFNILSALKELASDAFEGCGQLRLTPTLLQQLERFPDARSNMVSAWETKVRELTEAGDKLLQKKDITIADKQEAYMQYRRALNLDPFCMDVMHSLNHLLLSAQVPHCVTSFELSNLHYYLTRQNSLEALEFFDSTLVMLDAMCVIMSDPEDLITQRLVYGLNCDQTAAANLLEFLLDMIQQHPNITAGAKQKISKITGHLVCTPTRNKDAESQALFDRQKKRHQQIFPGSYYTTQMHNIIIELTSEKLMENFHEAMEKDQQQSFCDAELWLQIARAFNPAIEIPENFKKRQAKYQVEQRIQQWLNQQKELVFPTAPVLPSSSWPISSWQLPIAPPEEPPVSSYISQREKEEQERHNEIISEYWANVAAQREAAEIESLWGDLADIGFWDDTSWQ